MAQRRKNGSESTIDADEVARFDALASTWWDSAGPMAPLHRLNPIRLEFIRNELESHFDLDSQSLKPLERLRLIDVGCGGGLLSEPLARLGGEVTGIDVSAANIAVAKQHAAASELDIAYRLTSVEAIADAGAQFDAVVSMEVVEHVADLKAFLSATAAIVRPGGVILMATLNRTAKAYVQAILGAEYLLRWLPKGTHRWERFVKPAELRRQLADNGITLSRITGVKFDPLANSWRLSRDTAVNYMVSGAKI